MASNTLIEGLDDNQKTGLLQVIIPAADALETVSVSTSNYDAEFGRSGGAVTNVTLKSGTNDLKGSAFFFGNNETTNASDYFTHLKAPTKFVNGGFTLGGPIVKSKLFFFGDYQRTLDNNGYVVRATVPTLAMRNGDFSAVTNGIYDPLDRRRQRRGPRGVREQPDSAGPHQPDRPAAAGVHSRAEHRRRAARPEQLPEGADPREDHRRVRHQGELHGEREGSDVVPPQLHAAGGVRSRARSASTAVRPTAASPAPAPTRATARAGDLDARLQRQDRARRPRRPELLPQRHGDHRQRPDDQHRRRHPGRQHRRVHERHVAASASAGYSDPLLGFSASQPWDRSEKTWNVTATLTRLMQHAHRQAGRRVAAQPRHAAADAGCRRPARPLQLQRVGHRQPGRRRVDDQRRPTRSRRSCSTGRTPCSAISRSSTSRARKHIGTFLFVQDKWQARSNVTVDLGLRWEYYTPLVRARRQRAACPTTIRRPTRSASRATATPTNALNVKKNFTNFAPRTGVSWRLNEKTVVRAGYGASTIPFPDNRYAFNYPVKQNYAGTAANGFQRAGSMAAGLPGAGAARHSVERHHSGQRRRC